MDKVAGPEIRLNAAPARPRTCRIAGYVLLAVLVLLALARVPYAATHLDLARDIFVAWRFLHGEEVPLAGPVLAATIHLGPAWYWLLAALLALTRSWLGVLLLLGVLSALQYPLAYLAGKELHSRGTGLLWAVLLALPAWSSFEWLLPQHYVLTAPLLLATLVCLLRYRRAPRTRYLAGMALGLVLAVHAHPSSVGFAWPVLGVLAATALRRELRLKSLLVAAALALLPLLPYLLWSWNNDFADLRAGGVYLSDGRSTGNLASLPEVLYQSALGGALYWLQHMLNLPRALLPVALTLLALLPLGAAAGLWRLRRQPGGAALALQVLAAIAAIALTTALIRAQTTYYMTTPLRIAALGGIALGLAALGGGAGAAAPRGWRCAGAAALTGLVLAFNLASLLAANAYLRRGDWPFDFAALFDVTGTGAAAQRLPLLPARAMRASGEFLCSQAAPSVHGAYARHLLHDYAIEMRLACGRSDAIAGGADPARQHWLGLARTLTAQAGLRAERSLGPLQLFPVRRVLNGDAFPMPQTPVYPIHLPQANAPETRRFSLLLQPGERIAVSETAFFIAAAEVAFAGGAPQPRLLGGDAVSRVYGCEECAAPVAVELLVTTANFSDTDVVVF
ncbi:hypothetical protein [Tahibacter harae]|uniref:4-amino-4-deoxy-L-arabinose transferase-like glycosyltransferase n=1 Tax=Tahibacter harae TaxID=2963937 RepID=A0ABT1QRL0_9GAMM|nr:hypothetical protein [Tahibacter harae]MCQ4164943.1 hypothetical protein [Tahibacter harae]